MNKTIRIASNAVVAKVLDNDREVKMMISEWLSYQVQGFDQMPSSKTRGWDGRSTLFKFKTSTFPAGFVAAIKKNLQKKGVQVIHIEKEAPAPQGPKHPKVDDFPDDSRYSYQPETINRLLTYKRMIAQVATGGGKSRIARLAYARINRPTLFVTTRSVLMYQMKDNFEACLKQRVGVMGDGEWSPCRGFNVAMIQTLAQRIEKKDYETEIERALENMENEVAREIDKHKARLIKKKVNARQLADELVLLRNHLEKQQPSDKELIATIKKKVDDHNQRREITKKTLEKFELVILEEAHESGSDSYYNVMNACTNAHYRLALTGTPFMRDNAEDNLRLMGCTGPVAIKVTEKELIDKGILAKPIFKFVPTQRPKSLYRSTAWTKAYDVGIVNNEWRNNYIAESCREMASYGQTAMILIQRKKHGETLAKLLKKLGLKSEFIFGDNKQHERDAALKRLGNNEIDVLIGTNILDVGVDVPSVGAVILAGGGKAEVATRQRIGRGLRAKKSGPNVCLVIDFLDEHNDKLREHAFARKAIIDGTPGFAENVLKIGDSFDFEGLGFSKCKKAM